MIIFPLVVNQSRWAILRILQFFVRATNVIIQKITTVKLWKNEWGYWDGYLLSCKKMFYTCNTFERCEYSWNTYSLTCCSKAKWESSVKPKFLSVSQKSIQELPRKKPLMFNWVGLIWAHCNRSCFVMLLFCLVSGRIQRLPASFKYVASLLMLNFVTTLWTVVLVIPKYTV